MTLDQRGDVRPTDGDYAGSGWELSRRPNSACAMGWTTIFMYNWLQFELSIDYMRPLVAEIACVERMGWYRMREVDCPEGSCANEYAARWIGTITFYKGIVHFQSCIAIRVTDCCTQEGRKTQNSREWEW